MEELNVFSQNKQENTYKFYWAKGSPDIYLNEIPDDPQEAMDFLRKERAAVPVNLLQNLVNAMVRVNAFRKDVLLDLAFALHREYGEWRSDSDNNLFLCNVVTPLKNIILSENFSWNDVFLFLDNNVYLGDAVEYFNLSHDAFAIVVNDIIEGNELQSTEYYTLHCDPDFKQSECEMFPSISYYRVFKKVLDVSKYASLINKFADRVPVEALIPLAVLQDIGAPIDKLELYADKFQYAKFWSERLGLKSLDQITTEQIGLPFVKNFFAIYQLIFGEFLEQYGEQPMIYYGAEIVASNKQNVRCIERKTPYKYDHRLYLYYDGQVFSYTEGNIPYIWQSVKKRINEALSKPVLDAIVDFNSVNGQKATTLNIIQINQKSFRRANDHYAPFELENIYAEMTLADFTETIKRYLELGEQTKCYDYYLLFMIDIFYRDHINYAKWFKAYYLNPLAFSTGFVNAVVAYMQGAEDFVDFFESMDAGWYQAYVELANTFRPNYNFSAACFMNIMQKTGLLVKEFINVELDFNFPSEVIIKSHSGNEHVIEFKSMITNAEYYNRLYLNSFTCRPICYKDGTGRVIVAESR